jgi:hypothetical protein
MKKILALLVLATIVFAGCTKDKVNNLEEQIIGKWMTADINGQPAPTNEKVVLTFISDTKATMSASIDHQEGGSPWDVLAEEKVSINGNTVTLTGQPDENRTIVDENNITAINDREFTTNRTITITMDGSEVVTRQFVDRFVKVNDDYKQAVLGTWEGHVTSDQSEYDDYLEHRWQYNADGTYVYYNKDGNNWIPNPLNTLNEYFVDGNLLCMRWINNGAEYREWWEVASIEDNVMSWTALRKKADGTTYTASFSMVKVQ